MTEGRDNPPSRNAFVGHARVVAGVTLLSRFSGLARDAAASRVFGAGPVLSAFTVAFALPNLFRRLFGEGALSAAFIPVYAELQEEDPALADRYASALIGLALAAMGAVAALAAGALVLLNVFGIAGDEGGLTLGLAALMLFYMPLVCVSALLAGVLQTHGRFAAPAAAPIILNLCMISGIALGAWALDLPEERTVWVLGGAVIVAGALQAAWSLLALRGCATISRRFDGARAHIRTTMNRLVPALIGLGALQISSLIDQIIAGWPVLVGDTILGRPYPLDEDSASALFFAQRLYQFPLGVVGIAIATAVFPALARRAKDDEAFRDTLARGLRLSFFIGAPATAGLALVRAPIVATLYKGGNFDESDAARVGSALLGYAVAVWAYTLSHTLTRAFYAQGDTRTPMRLSLLSVAANLVLNIALLALTDLKEAALAWATAATACAQCVLLLLLASRRSWGALGASVPKSFVSTLAATAVMSAAVLALREALPQANTWLGDALTLAALTGAGALVYYIVSRLLRRPEAGWIFERG